VSGFWASLSETTAWFVLGLPEVSFSSQNNRGA